MKMCSNFHTRVVTWTQNTKMCSDDHTKVGTLNMKLRPNVHTKCGDTTPDLPDVSEWR